jgi:hypothetical protein
VAEEIVPGVGHSMQHQDPVWVISRLTRFLAEYAVAEQSNPVLENEKIKGIK